MTFKLLKTGVEGLNVVAGGGLPEFSFNLIAGSPGAGKTTLAHQIMFANASEERPALYFTVLGEPTLKMLRYQQQYSFYDAETLQRSVRYINLSDVVKNEDLSAVSEVISKEVENLSPAMVFVDSFRTVARRANPDYQSMMGLQSFVENLALFLTSSQATTFLIGEYSTEEMQHHPVFTMADGLFWLSQVVEGNSILRKMQIIKLRGQAQIPGLHTFRITNDGVQVFPRTFGLDDTGEEVRSGKRLSVGVPQLDQMMGGGALEGDSILVAGPTGSGKSILAKQFIAEGLKSGESAVVAVFEERPFDYGSRGSQFGLDLAKSQQEGTVRILTLRPLDLSVDEAIQDIWEAVKETGAKRLVVDSLSGLELALTQSARHDFREALYRMMRALTRTGVTIMNTVEIPETSSLLYLGAHAIPFLTDDIITFNNIVHDGEFHRVVFVKKMRGSSHSKEIREYDISEDGLGIGQVFKDLNLSFE
jgi:circadian clock protein KaiC